MCIIYIFSQKILTIFGCLSKINCKHPVPSYFKNVLKACGYNNGLTIASIEEEDIAYIESEVRNENVTEYFVELEQLEERDVLEGSTKNKDNFVFTLGPKKFLMFIVNYLKTEH